MVWFFVCQKTVDKGAFLGYTWVIFEQVHMPERPKPKTLQRWRILAFARMTNMVARMKRPRLLIPAGICLIGLVMTALSLLPSVVPTAQAHGGNVQADQNQHNYIIHSSADGSGSNADGTNVNVFTRQLFDIGTSSSGSTASYIPNQYFVASDKPELSFEMRDGGFNCGSKSDDSADSWVKDFVNSQGYDSPVYYEVYQLRDGEPRDGTGDSTYGTQRGKLLGTINPRDCGNFPGDGSDWREFSVNLGGGNISTDGSTQRSCYTRNNSSGADCKKSNGKTAPAKDQDITAGTFSPVVDARFSSRYYPNLNGYYTFLIKMVHYDDLKRGYVPLIQDIRRENNNNAGCALTYYYPKNTNYLNCPSDLVAEKKSHGINSGGGNIYISNMYFMRAKQTFPDGGQNFIATAPTNVFADIVYGGGSSRPALDWSGLRFAGGGAGCRGDGYQYGLDGTTPGRLTADNADWDKGSGNPGGDIGAVVNPGNHTVPNSSISANWQKGLWTIDLDRGRFWRDHETEHGTLKITSMKPQNNMYQGGPPFTWGPWPTCRSSISITPLTPKPFTSGYLYNGHDSVTQSAGVVDSRLNYSFTYTLNNTGGAPRGSIDWRTVVDGQIRATGSQGSPAFGTPNYAMPDIQSSDLAPNTNHTWYACVSASGFSSGIYGVDQTCTAPITFRMNGGPTPSGLTSGTTLSGTLTDPESHPTQGQFTLAWTENGNSNVVRTDESPAKGSGSAFTSNEVHPISWTVNGTAKAVPNPPKTLTDFLAQDVPEGVRLTWYLRGHDTAGASDLAHFAWLTASPKYNEDNGGLPSQQSPTGFRWGPYGSAIRPGGAVLKQSTKQIVDANNNPVTQVTDGQRVRVKMTITNTGDVGAAYYELKDYFGSIRDFEQPTNVRIAKNRGVDQSNPIITPPVSRVVANRDKPATPDSPLNDIADKVPLFAFWSSAYSGHYNTTLGGPYVVGQQYWGDWLHYRIDGYLPQSPVSGSAPLWGLYNYGVAGSPCPGSSNNSCDWLVTTNPAEYDPAYLASIHYTAENIKGYLMQSQVPGTVPVWRLYSNTGAADHFISTDAGERDYWAAHGYNVEGIIGYIFTDASIDTTLGPEFDKVIPAETPGNPDATNPDYRNGAWRIDLRSNRGPFLPAEPLAPGEFLTLNYDIRANRNQKIQPGDGDNGNLARRVPLGDTHTRARYQPDPSDGSVRKYKDPDVLASSSVIAPWVRGGRGSIHSNSGLFGFDSPSGQQNATFTVSSSGTISHFSSTAGQALPGYTSSRPSCASETSGGQPSGGIDWRRDMITSTNRLEETTTNAISASDFGSGTFNLTKNGVNVWKSSGDLNINTATAFSGTGTIIVHGNLNINANLTYGANAGTVNSLGLIVLGNVNILPAVNQVVGSYYVSDSSLSLDSQSCPVIVPGTGTISTGNSAAQLNVQGLMIARSFNLDRYFVDSTDTTSDPAENVYYDGRVVANTPPGFGSFRTTTAWYEVGP